MIATALPVEYAAVRASLVDIREIRDNDGTIFETGVFTCQGGAWTVALVTTGKGNVSAAIMTGKAIARFGPTVVLFVGVAGGVKDVLLDDVVVADKVYEYARGKATKAAFLPRPEVKNVSYKLLQQAQALARDEAWHRSSESSALHNSSRCNVIVGPIAAGEAVVASTKADLYAHLKQNYGDTVAVEMEGSGFLTAAYVTDRDALVIRGISDLLDRKGESDSQGHQEVASRNASRFAFALLARLLTTSIRPRRSTRKPSRRAPSPPATTRPSPEARYHTQQVSERGVVTHVRGVLDPSSLTGFVDGRDWLVGAVNFDEDLHFSSFYIRRSCEHYLGSSVPGLGYSDLVATYEDFRETYYVPKVECIRVAQTILDRTLENPLWLQDVLNEIYARSRSLEAVFTDGVLPFSRLTDSQLLEIYAQHNRVHGDLYSVSRIPEAMDRGVTLFTNYLKSYLKARSASLTSPRELNRVFEIVTFPEEMSAIRREQTEFHELLAQIKHSAEQLSVLSRGGQRAWLGLAPNLRSRIESHRARWGYLGYHGYGARTLPDVNHYIQRLTLAMNDAAEPQTTADYKKLLDQGETKRLTAFAAHKIDSTHQMLFRLHSRIGIAKLFRRYVQLRNFHYLDQLLSDVSRRTEYAEAVIRSLLPEEVEWLLEGGRFPATDVEPRTKFSLFVIRPSAEAIFAGTDFLSIKERLTASVRTAATSSRRLEGTPAQTGIARGACKIIVRPSDAQAVNFQRGDILISESTDPDLLPLIQQAAGVVTEQGGVTSHAAIVCRELGKPALIGVAGLLKLVKNDDYAVLNADEGFLSLVKWEQRQWTVPDSRVALTDRGRLGAKACNLAQMSRNGFRVPRFFVVPLDSVAAAVAAQGGDAMGAIWKALSSEIEASLEYLTGDLFVVRTSMPVEDSVEASHAGEFHTESHVERQDIVALVVRQLNASADVVGESAGGSIIVQEMVLGDFSGVCFTHDPTTTTSGNMLVEVVPGGNDALTSGKVVPARYRLHRDTLVVERDETAANWTYAVPRDMWPTLNGQFQRIEALFGGPQDIEWTSKDGDLWLLQSRPIVQSASGPGTAPVASSRRGIATGPRDVSSVYSAYRVPPSIRLHMLRVAAVAQLICDRWSGPSIDRNSITVTCLLHDVGNIVKANYDDFPILFPEEMQDLSYWKAVQGTLREKYGDTDQAVTLAIARELGLNARVIELLQAKTFLRNIDTAAGTDWEAKICAYADQRVGPTGVLTLSERMSEARRRYRGVPYATVNDPRFIELQQAGRAIENQVLGQSSMSGDDISDLAIEPVMRQLRSFVL